jgi:hypothetical protein
MGQGVERKRVRKHHSRTERRRKIGERYGRVEESSRNGLEMERKGRKASGERARGSGRGNVQKGMWDQKREREHRRKWTVNRSPHGNKTARDQLGREEWKRSRSRKSGGEGLGSEAGEAGAKRSRGSVAKQQSRRRKPRRNSPRKKRGVTQTVRKE